VTGATYAEFGPRGRGMGDWAQPDDANVFDVEDLAAGFIRFENGASVVLEASWAQFVPEDTLYSTLYGTEGGANVSPYALYKDDAQGKVADERPTLEEVEGHHAEVIHFVDCMLTGKTPIGTVDEGYAVMQILDALYRSAASGAEVRL
jgi:predicted dehydrogenase